MRRYWCGLVGVLMATSLIAGGLSAETDRAGDAYRPVVEVTRTSVVLQWYTPEPTETRVMLRQGDVSMAAWRPEDQRQDVWADARQIDGPAGKRTYHRLVIDDLQPGRRYFYRVYDPSATPTEFERRFGAAPPWGREYAVATRAAEGERTIIRLPVKVLLMPNVLNIASAHTESGTVPPPPKLTDEQLQLVKEEYAVAARYLFVNSGLRLWVDFEFFIDDRWQRWGDEPENAAEVYRGWPVCRSYSGVDYRFPGGGTFTVVDTRDIERAGTNPVYEDRPYAGQVEQAFLRQWNAKTGEWEFRRSGGGTYGPDRFNEGLPGRSQYLGGVDIAWTTTHEFHHQMEGLSRVSFPHAEHDRIIYNHPEVRRRVMIDDKEHINAWTASGRHGEHWDVMAFWDRTLTDTQWLRIYLGEVVTVADADGDGVPDDDPRLPLDEKRFGSDPTKAATDGKLNDRDKIMLATWAPAPLQPSWTKPRDQLRTADPRRADSDGDGLDDGIDPYPLDPYPPFVWPKTTVVDGDASEWEHVPIAGALDRPAGESGDPEAPRLHVTYKQAYDDTAYRGLIRLGGPWKELKVSLDGEGDGYFSDKGVVEFVVKRDGDAAVVEPTARKAPGLQWKAGQDAQGFAIVEFSLPNGGEGIWFWRGAGREIGTALQLTDSADRLYSVYEPYRLFYARMLPRHGEPR